jgi:hypothetical protein
LSGGLTTYPRTGGGGGSDLARIQALIGQLSSTDLARNDLNARQILQALTRYEQSAQSSRQDVIQVATDVRNALFSARIALKLTEAFHKVAMAICAAAFKALNPLSATGFAARSQRALNEITAIVPGNSQTTLRRYQEEIGIVALLYEVSALLGQDIATTILANPQQLAPRWTAVRSGNTLVYLEPGGSYNVNVMISIEIPGCKSPLVLVGEAKGGASTYGSVKGPVGVLDDLGLAEVKQNQIEYAVTRAAYMRNERGNAPDKRARREAGDIIMDAWEQDRLAYAAARGKVSKAGAQTTRLDTFDCQ